MGSVICPRRGPRVINLLPLLFMTASCAHGADALADWDAIVDSNDSSAYQSVAAALAAAPPTSARPYRIFIKPGRYYEKLTVSKPNIHLIGAHRETTIITYDAASDTPNPEGGTYGTRGSFTIKIVAPD